MQHTIHKKSPRLAVTKRAQGKSVMGIHAYWLSAIVFLLPLCCKPCSSTLPPSSHNPALAETCLAPATPFKGMAAGLSCS